jgi:hypothetical protein
MKSVLLICYLSSIVTSAVMSLVCRKSLGSRHLIVMLPYLFYVSIQEIVIALGYQFEFLTSNAVIYNIYKPVSVIVFFWVYFNIPFMASLRKLFLGIAVLYILLTIINYCFLEPISATSSYVSLARGSVITFYGIMFLFRFFYLDKRSEERYWRPVLWVTIAIVTFYPVVSISLNFHKYLLAGNSTFFGLSLYNVIPQLMSIFMYSCFSYAFYLCKKIN